MINIVFNYPIGATFVDWSIKYIGGLTEFYNIDNNRYMPLVANPLKFNNAHIHCRNEMHSINDVNQGREILSLTKNNTFQSIISHPMTYDECYVLYPGQNEKYNEYILDNYNRLIENSVIHNDKLILLSLTNPLLIVRDDSRTDLTRITNTNISFNNKTDFNVYRQQLYYNRDDINYWNDNELIWNQREYLALNMRIYENLDKRVGCVGKHFKILDNELYNDFHNKVMDLISFVGLGIDKSRFTQWTLVYNEWRKIHLPYVRYSMYFEYILESIVNNYYLDLQEFNLDLMQEAMILHALIYDYNLNIKSRGLDKFPKNTQELYKLLEPNQHPLK